MEIDWLAQPKPSGHAHSEYYFHNHNTIKRTRNRQTKRSPHTYTIQTHFEILSQFHKINYFGIHFQFRIYLKKERNLLVRYFSAQLKPSRD